jgi:WD40 repeat protein
MTVWDVEQQTFEIIIANECRGVSALATAANGERAALAPASGGIQLWRLEPEKKDLLQKVLIVPQEDEGCPVPQNHVSFSRRGRFLASSNTEGTITIWNAHSGDVLVTFNNCQCCLTALALSPAKEELLAYACEDSTIRLYNLGRREEIRRFTLPDAVPQALAFSQDGGLLAVGNRNCVIRLYDLTTFALKDSIRAGGSGRSVTDLVFLSRKADMLASWASDGGARFWEVKGSRLIQRGECMPQGALHLLAAISPSGQEIAIITRNRRLGIWSVKNDKQFELTDPGRDHSGVTRLAFSPKGQILASASDDMTIILWDVSQRREAICLTTKPEEPRSLAFDHSASRMAVGLAGGKVLLYDFTAE